MTLLDYRSLAISLTSIIVGISIVSIFNSNSKKHKNDKYDVVYFLNSHLETATDFGDKILQSNINKIISRENKIKKQNTSSRRIKRNNDTTLDKREYKPKTNELLPKISL